jgi:inositol oxygenase
MQVTGLIHDLGKLMYFDDTPSWSAVGDTFVVGAEFSDKNIYPETCTSPPLPSYPQLTLSLPVKANPDYHNPELNTPLGIYAPNCGLDNVMISWGHDEYLYLVMKEQSSLPKEALSMIRYHSFYPWHRGGAYTQFMGEGDAEQLKAVRAFNRMSSF